MDFTSLLNPKHWFGKTEEQSSNGEDAPTGEANTSGDSAQQPSQSEKSETSLEGVSLYVMPKATAGEGGAMTAGSTAASSAASGAASDATKRTGIIIIAVGGIVLFAAAAALVWYIFFTGPATPASAPVADVPAAGPAGEDPSLAIDDEEAAPETAEPAAEEPVEVACGSAVWYGSASSTPLEDTSGWECFGERLQNECAPARMQVETAAGTNVEVAVTEAPSGECAVEITFPNRVAINDETLEPYANTRLQCPYTVSSINTDMAVTIAKEAYATLSPLTLTADTQCSGTALTAWEEQQQGSDDDEVATTVVPGTDTDGDGLSDVEERAVYVTAVDVADTDNDGYDDGVEVANKYNPAGGGTLAESGLVETENNGNYGYSFWYPAAWDIQTQSGGETVLITAPTGGFIQIVAHENTEGSSLSQWYIQTTGADTAPATLETDSGFTYMLSADGLTAYGLFSGNSETVLVITYSPTTGRIEYQATFDMLIASLTQ